MPHVTKNGIGLGYRPDPAHKRTQKPFHAHPLFMSAAPPPAAASLKQFEAPIYDQGPTGSCVGHGTSQMVYITAAANRFPLGYFPSPRGIYTDARALERADASAGQPDPVVLPQLEDGGAMPADAFRAICPAPGTAGGVRPMNPKPPTPDGRFSDVTTDNVNSEETLADIEAESPVCGEYRIQCPTDNPNVTQAGVALQIKTAVAGLCANGVGVLVGPAFMNYSPQTGPITAAQAQADIAAVNANPNVGGGHWLCLDYYYTTPAGVLVIGGPNSWNDQWGSAGHWEAEIGWLMVVVSDIYVATPKLTLATPEAA